MPGVQWEAAVAFIRKTLIFAALCAPLVPFGLSAQTPNVVVSLKPIHSLVAGVMGEAGEPRLLLKGTASPHTYQMRPSDARALGKADLIVWVGEPMETFLHRAIENLGSRSRVVTLHKGARNTLAAQSRRGDLGRRRP